MVAAVTVRLVRWVVVAVAALAAVWLVAPAAVPIYDGPGFPDEAYRWVQAPAGAKQTPAPTAAKASITVGADGLSAAGYSNSSERGPQVVLYVPKGSLKAPAGAKTIQVSETPAAPSPPLPTDGTIVSNVYRITATAPQGEVTMVGRSENQIPTLQMRAPDTQVRPVFEHRTSAGWERSETLRVGQDIYQTSASAFGDWALVQPKAAASKKSSGGINVGLLAAGVAVLVLAGIILAIRISRSRRT